MHITLLLIVCLVATLILLPPRKRRIKIHEEPIELFNYGQYESEVYASVGCDPDLKLIKVETKGMYEYQGFNVTKAASILDGKSLLFIGDR
jgi:hypothetical protein